MKLIKKIMLMITTILLVILAASCYEEKVDYNNNAYYANNLIKQVDLTENNSVVDTNFQVPGMVSFEDVSTALTWKSNNESYLTFVATASNYEAIITQTSYPVNLKLTCYLDYQGEKREKEFSITIAAMAIEPVEPDNPFSFVVDGDYAYDSILDVEVYEDNIYNTPFEVALYIVAFAKLPSNFLPKSEFNRNDYTQENLLSCGGDVFQNREGLLPRGDSYFECDILYTGGSRNAKRIVFSLETLSVYYTIDHYSSFNYIYLNGNCEGSIYVS